MSRRLTRTASASWIASKLSLKLVGPDLDIKSVNSLGALEPNSLSFSKSQDNILAESPLLVIGSAAIAHNLLSVLCSDSPRLDFARALHLLAQEVGFKSNCDLPDIHPTAKIGRNVEIGNGAKIGAGTVIYPNVVIAEDVIVGEHCLIKSGSVIGQEGFGFERDSNGIPIRLLHLGSVVIGNYVEIGSLNTVCRGTLGDTILEDHVKTDDHVHIAHNCIIRKNVLITACAELSGGVEICQGAWVGPNCSIIQKAKIGEKATVGLGAVVTRNVEPESVAAGSPARHHAGTSTKAG